MTKLRESNLVSSNKQSVIVSAVKTYMRSNGWVLKEATVGYDSIVQEEDRQPRKAEKATKRVHRQKSWVPWPKV